MIKFSYCVVTLTLMVLSSLRVSSQKKDYKQSVDFRVEEGFIYLNKIEINGQEINCKFLLDNGCVESFISESLAEKLIIEKKGKKKVKDAYGKKERLCHEKLDYNISGVQFKNIKTAILPDSNFETDGCDVNGIIGRNLMEKSVWSISKKQGIIISNNVALVDTKDYYKQPLVFGTGIDFGFVHGDSAIACIIDLGSQSFLDFSPIALKRINTGNREARIKQTKTLGYNTIFSGIDKELEGKVVLDTGEVKVEGFYIPGGDKVVLNPIIDIDAKSDDYIPYIGCEILNYYDIILDGVEKQFYFKNIETNYKHAKEYGFGFVVKDSMVQITVLDKNGIAMNTGLHIGDRIVEINNISVVELLKNKRSCEYMTEVMNEIGKNEYVSLKIIDQEDDILIHKDYYFTF